MIAEGLMTIYFTCDWLQQFHEQKIDIFAQRNVQCECNHDFYSQLLSRMNPMHIFHETTEQMHWGYIIK